MVPASAPKAQTRHAAIVVDGNTGKVLHDQLADAPRHPASLTKMMTLYLTFEEIEAGRLSYTSKIPISAKASSAPPSKLELEPGDELELLDAIKALIVKSANDVATAVAERIGGTEAGFVRLMNERARQMGMRATTFTNPSGLPDAAQITTARDMLTLALRLCDDFPSHYRLFSLKSFTFRGKTYRTHNALLRGFPGMDGIKTGYTRASGYNLVSSVNVDGKHVVAALFGGVAATTRNAHMRSLLFRALQKASTEKTRQPVPLLTTPPTKRQEIAAQPEPWRTETKEARKHADKPRRNDAKAVGHTPRRDISDASASDGREPAAARQPEMTAAATPEISLAKVRVLTTTPARPASPPEAVPEASAVNAVPKLDLMALRAAISSETASSTESGIPSPDRTTAPTSIEDIITGAPPEAPPLGRPPSALDRQAALAEGPHEPTTRGDGSAPTQHVEQPPVPSPPQRDTTPREPVAAASIGAGFEIQIGAYATAADAENRIAAAKSRATRVLEGHSALTIPVQKGDRQIFRARFGGFDEEGAANACLELRRLAIDCFVMKTD